MIRSLVLSLVASALMVHPAAPGADAQPPPTPWPALRAHPQNPAIFDFRGQATVLLTHAEHYSAVVNRNFDYETYLDVLERDGMNLTRVFLMGYRAAHPIPTGDPLDVPAQHYLQPWRRVEDPALHALDGLGKWDFEAWNEDYFTRLREFVRAAGERGIVVECTFFCTYYKPSTEWAASPFNPANNIRGTGTANCHDCFRAIDPDLLAVQQAAVRRIARELNGFDNIYYEIQNEPYWNEPQTGDALEAAFHNTVLGWLRDEESNLPFRHLVAHNFPQQSAALSAGFDIINAHYPAPLTSTPLYGAEVLLQKDSQRGRILSLDETSGPDAVANRLESWMFILGGGAVYNGLDIWTWVFNEADPGGDNPLGESLRTAVRQLHDHVDDLDLVRLRRDVSWLTGEGIASGATVQAMASAGQQYVAYFHHGGRGSKSYYEPIDGSPHVAAPVVTLDAGSWRAQWTRPADLAVLAVEEFVHEGGTRALLPVGYREDVALRIDRTGAEDHTPPPHPRDLTADPRPAGVITLQWSGVRAADLAGYRIYRAPDAGIPPDEEHRLAEVAAGTTSWADENANLDQIHHYRVTAVDANGNESSPSNEASAPRPGPTARAGQDQSLLDDDNDGAVIVTLDGGESTSGDSPIVSHTWHEGGTLLATDAAATVTLAPGVHTLTLTVTDEQGMSDRDELQVTIRSRGLINGGFENDLAGWQWSRNVSIRSGAPYAASEGSRLVAFNAWDRNPDGVLAQTFTTTPGQAYRLTFDLGVLAWTLYEQQLKVDVVGHSRLLGSSLKIAGKANGSLYWLPQEFTFTADSPTTLLMFRDQSVATRALDLLLDAVRITPRITRTLRIDSTPAQGAFITVEPSDEDDQASGLTPVIRKHPDGARVTLAAPLRMDGLFFKGWSAGDGTPDDPSNPLVILMDRDRATTAVYAESAPLILTQPADAVVAAGTRAVFTVEADGSGLLAYQWRFNGTDLEGANQASLVIDRADASSAGTYDVRISNPLGTVVSRGATLTIASTGLANGGFEQGFDGWDLSGNPALQDSPPYLAAEGRRLVSFNQADSPPGGRIRQIGATIPGRVHQLDFELGTLAYNTREQALEVRVSNGDVTLASQVFRITGAGGGSVRWRRGSLRFTADASGVLVSFRDVSTNTKAIDLLLDGVRLSEAAVPPPSILVNGSFEQGLGSWTATGNLGLVEAPLGTLPEGIRCVVFNSGNAPPNGALSQTFATAPGTRYQVSLSLGVLSYQTGLQIIRASTGDGSTTVDVAIRGSGNGTTAWEPRQFEFTASGTATTLVLRDVSTSTRSIDVLLDQVTVTPVNPAATAMTAHAIMQTTSGEPTPPPVIRHHHGTVEITGLATRAGLHELQQSADLQQWRRIAVMQAESPGEIRFSGIPADPPRMFYRIVTIDPPGDD